jgi:hypothetical protein
MVVGRQERGIAVVASREKELLQERVLGGRQRHAARPEAGGKRLRHDRLDGVARDVGLLPFT